MSGGVRRHRLETLWARIERNGPKLAVYLTAFVLAWALGAEIVVVLPLAVLVWWVNLRHDVPTPFLGILVWGGAALVAIGAAWAAAASTRSERSLLAKLGARRVAVGELPETKRALHDMAIAVGLPFPPPLYVLETWALNAFVVGKRPERAAVGVTRGLLAHLTGDEQRAVFANLLTRLRGGDVLVATVVSSLMSPEWVWRRAAVSGEQDEASRALVEAARSSGSGYSGRDSGAGGLAYLFAVWVLAAFVTEFLYFGQMQQQILVSEAADAKGMMLLKEPRAMLSALRKVLPEDNAVPNSGAALAPLFFAWTGDAYCDERDPEMRRVSRLREVLGAEGMAEEPRSAGATGGAEVLPPPAPRLGA